MFCMHFAVCTGMSKLGLPVARDMAVITPAPAFGSSVSRFAQEKGTCSDNDSHAFVQQEGTWARNIGRSPSRRDIKVLHLYCTCC